MAEETTTEPTEPVASEPQPTPEATAGEAVVEPAPTSKPVVEQVPEQASEPQISESTSTAQPVEPLNPEPVPEPVSTPEPIPEPVAASAPSSDEPKPEPPPVIEPTPAPEPTPVSTSSPQAPVIQTSLARELLVKAREVIQFRKRKKLEKIMSLFLKKQTITNDDVQKLVYVSDATATRYLDQLEQEGKIKHENAGKYLSYSRI